MNRRAAKVSSHPVDSDWRANVASETLTVGKSGMFVYVWTYVCNFVL